jgi:hypothetical protein
MPIEPSASTTGQQRHADEFGGEHLHRRSQRPEHAQSLIDQPRQRVGDPYEDRQRDRALQHQQQTDAEVAHRHRHRVQQAHDGRDQPGDVQCRDDPGEHRDGTCQPFIAHQLRTEPNEDPDQHKAFGQPQQVGAIACRIEGKTREPEGQQYADPVRQPGEGDRNGPQWASGNPAGEIEARALQGRRRPACRAEQQQNADKLREQRRQQDVAVQPVEPLVEELLPADRYQCLHAQ